MVGFWIVDTWLYVLVSFHGRSERLKSKKAVERRLVCLQPAEHLAEGLLLGFLDHRISVVADYCETYQISVHSERLSEGVSP